jgi:prevent-host-death family protein
MSIAATDIRPLTEFQRNTKEAISRLRKTGRPEVLTVNGRPAVVVQTPEAYEEIAAIIERLEAAVGIQRGLDDRAAGRGRPLREIIEERAAARATRGVKSRRR